jgi:uncharacterized repeat protein (TIGR03803 family)
MGRDQSRGKPAFLVALVAFALAAGARAAPKYKILHTFGRGKDGDGLWGSLALDAKGDLYGMARGGGDSCCGIVFELTPHADGHWTETALEELDCGGEAGCMPQSGFVVDAAGNLYGMTTGGNEFGSVFELSPGAGGGWGLTVLHGGGAWATLLLDQAGNLYGPMRSIGKYGQGAISELVKDDGWTEKWLYSFCAKGTRKHDCLDGSDPWAGVIWGPDGSIYGTTVQYGVHGYGVVFQLTLQSDGTWKETVLHSFPAFEGDGQTLYNGVTLDSRGNLYGATYQGGSTDCGVIFELTPQASGRWKETILYDFKNKELGCSANPLTFDAKGNLWGTAGGGEYGDGVVFELSPQSSGKWKYSVVHQFNGTDGAVPASAVIFDKQGNLYGGTVAGGAYGEGVAFEITP